MNLKISKQTLNIIIEELNKPSQDDYTTIENVLNLCPKNVGVTFAYQSCLTIKHLIKDARSIKALEAVELYLSDGTPVHQDAYYAARAAASAAYATVSAAYYAANTASAAYYADVYDAARAAASAAYYAASAAADAAYTANSAAAYAADLSHQRVIAEKLRELLLLLKDIVLDNLEEDCRSELLELAI